MLAVCMCSNLELSLSFCTRRKSICWEAIVILQVGDSVIVGSEEILEVEVGRSKAFICKPKTFLEGQPTTVNGVELSLRQNGEITIAQKKKIENPVTSTTEDEFRSQRSLAKYIGVSCRPDVFDTVQLIEPRSTKVENAQFKSLRKEFRHLNETKKVGLDFVKLNIAPVRLIFCPMRHLLAWLGWRVSWVSWHFWRTETSARILPIMPILATTGFHDW